MKSNPTVRCSRMRIAAVVALAGVGLAGCGFGTAGVTALSNSGGGSSNAESIVSSITVIDPVLSPATLSLVVADPEEDPVTVRFFYVAPDDPRGQERPMVGLDQNPVTLQSSRAGLTARLAWRFADETHLDGSYRSGVRVIARIEGGASLAATASLGNDLPVLDVLEPAPPAANLQVSGVARLRFSVLDPNHRVNVVVEYRDLSQPASGWQLARRAGASQTEPVALVGVGTPGTESVVDFFWDTDIDFADQERRVRVRFTPSDPVGVGLARETVEFSVDNNDEPIVQVDGGFLAANVDSDGGITVPYVVTDEEADPVRVLFQWRRPGEAFVPLGTTDPNELLRLLDDPAFIDQKRICVPYDSYIGGYAVPVDPATVRLPSLVTSAAWLRVALEHREVQFLRSRVQPTGLVAEWSGSPLRAPVGAVPVGDGTRALVLDAASGGSVLSEVELSTGVVTRTVATLAGAPSTLAVDADNRQALIGHDTGGRWQLSAVSLDDGSVLATIDGGAGSGPDGAPRSVLPWGPSAALVSADDALWRIDWSGAPVITRWIGGLAHPSGLAWWPGRPGRCLLAERDANRVVQLDLATRVLESVRPGGASAFPTPTSIALTDDRRRLVVLCEPTPGADRELRAVTLGSAAAAGANPVTSLGTVANEARALAAGPLDLVLVADPVAADLLASGGVAQTAVVRSVSGKTGDVTFVAPLAAAVSPGQRWRVAARDPFRHPVASSRTGQVGHFIWDSRTVAVGGQFLVRAICFDEEQGSSSSTTVAKQVLPSYATVSSQAASRAHRATAVGDFDGDGDTDYAVLQSGPAEVTVMIQGANRSFAAQTPIAVPGTAPAFLIARDFDGDGDHDFAVGDSTSSDVTVFLQASPGSFFAQPSVSTGAPGLAALVAADLDSDGDVDLAASHVGGEVVALWRNGATSFSVETLATISAGRPEALAAADVDGDGNVDLLSAHSVTDDVVVLRHGAGRTFAALAPVATGGIRPKALQAVDLDADGDVDVLCAHRGSNDVTVLRASAAGALVAEAPVAALRPEIESMVVADLDHDGDLDVALASAGVRFPAAPSGVTFLFQDSTGALVPAGEMRVGTLGINALATADFDVDGRSDLLLADASAATVFFQSAAGEFTPTDPHPTRRLNPTAVAVGDLDGDGDLDVVTTDLDFVPTPQGSLTVFFQDAPRVFTSLPEISTVGRGPLGVALGDVDGDGDLDVVTTNELNNSLSVIYQGAARTFGPVQTVGARGIRPAAIAIGDVDGDGGVDLVSVNRGGRFVVHYQGESGVFTTPGGMLLGGASATDVAIGDLDGDGAVDVVAANGTSNSVTIAFQDAPRSFSVGAPIATGGGFASAVVIADLDRDGDTDVACANRDTNDVTVLVQVAPRSFVVRPPVGCGGIAPESLAASDIDRDGAIDLICVHRTSADFSVLRQVDGGFATGVPIATGQIGPSAVAVGDIDRDGDPDVAIVGYDSSDLRVFWGGR